MVKKDFKQYFSVFKKKEDSVNLFHMQSVNNQTIDDRKQLHNLTVTSDAAQKVNEAHSKSVSNIISKVGGKPPSMSGRGGNPGSGSSRIGKGILFKQKPAPKGAAHELPFAAASDA